MEPEEAIEAKRQASEPESPEEINTGPKTAVDYLDQIDEANLKLSGIIECICGYQGEAGENFGNLGLAMHDYTKIIEQSSDDLSEYLRDIGVPEIEAAKQKLEA